MKIAILGWGSLIWDLRDLELASEWNSDGPVLPLEFSRISGGNRLTLVIDPINGVQTQTLYALSAKVDLDGAVENLRSRERTRTDRIGFLTMSGEQQCCYQLMLDGVRSWMTKHDVEAVVWTDLPSNFEDEAGQHFSVEHALAYLLALPTEKSVEAKRYFMQAPEVVDTPVRRAVRASRWLEV